jgi:glycine oxidase
MPEPGNSVKGDRSYNEGMAKIPDVLVLGGGIIGLTSAYLLAKAGVNVEVFDRQEMGREASWAGAGILPPFGDVSGAKSPIDALRANSVAGFAALSEELESLTGRPTGYRITGGIEVLHPESEYCLPLWASEKIVHERIDKQTLTRLEPDAHTNAEDIYYLPGFAQVRNPWHLKALIAACEYQGVTLTPDCQFESWELADGRVRGLFDSSGRLREAGA